MRSRSIRTVFTTLTLAFALAGAAACVHSVVEAPVVDVAVQARTELDHAVARYHDTGDFHPLKVWVDTHPDHPDASVWREVVALRLYERLVVGDPFEVAPQVEGQDPALATLPQPTAAALTDLALAYPNTIGGHTAVALVEADGLRRLSLPTLNPHAAAFLAGDDSWVIDEQGRDTLPNVDRAEFRSRHEPTLRDRFRSRLLEDRCITTMGYCTWWVRTFPNTEPSRAIETAMNEVWYKRAHPRWRGKKYATCAYRCAKRCRRDTTPFADSCFDPCFARCG